MTTELKAFPALEEPKPHPLLRLIGIRALTGVIVLFVVSVIIFYATQILPGNAATEILGHSASQAQVKALEAQLHLDQPPIVQYGTWIHGVLTGDLGHSLANSEPVWTVVGPAIANSAVLLLVSGVVGSLIALILGVCAAAWRDSILDRVTALISLVVISLPEFVVAIIVLFVLSTNVFHLFPAASVPAPGSFAFSDPALFVMPSLTLIIIVIPYILRMTRAATAEALASDYVELARLKGVSERRVLLLHALPNAMPPIVQVIGLTFLYLAGGVVIVEYVFTYPGVGNALVSAVNNRDVPVIQCIVLLLALFYIVINALSDIVALLASPRRLYPR
jgi:peptide/nickel transport system permease protein